MGRKKRKRIEKEVKEKVIMLFFLSMIMVYFSKLAMPVPCV
jgi:hypothetical protein